MTRPVDKSSSQTKSSVAIAQAVALLEKDAGRQAQAARSTYAAGMKILKTDFDLQQRALAAAEREELKRIERWRIGAVAAVEGRPVAIADVRSVRGDVVKSSSGISLPRLSCLEGRK